MDIKEFSKLIRAKQKEIDTLMRRKMPIRVGNMAKRHFQDNFRKSGFVDGGLHPWPKTKRQLSGGTSAASQHKPLLSNRNHLFNAVRYVPGDYRVKIVNDVPYAPIHNWGGETKPTVTPKMRRFAWAMYYRAAGKPKTGTKGRKAAENAPRGALSPEAQMLLFRQRQRAPHLRLRHVPPYLPHRCLLLLLLHLLLLLMHCCFLLLSCLGLLFRAVTHSLFPLSRSLFSQLLCLFFFVLRVIERLLLHRQ